MNHQYLTWAQQALSIEAQSIAEISQNLGDDFVQAASAHSPASHAILRDFNASLPHDSRIVPLTLPLGDGLTLVRKK